MKRTLERFDDELHAPCDTVVLRIGRESGFVGLLGRLAVGARENLAGVRQSALCAEAKDAGRSGVRLSARFDTAKDKVLRSNANAVAVAEERWPADEEAVHSDAISALQILDTRTVIVDDDFGVLA